MTVKGVSTKTRGDYVVVDLADGRVVALDLVTVHRSLGARPREVVAAAPDPHVFIDRSLPGRSERPGEDALAVTVLGGASDGMGFVARLASGADLVLTVGELAALIDALEHR